MKSHHSVSDRKKSSRVCTVFIAVPLVLGAFFLCSAWLGGHSSRSSLELQLRTPPLNALVLKAQEIKLDNATEELQPDNKCRLSGIEALPAGIVSRTSNLEMQALWGRVNSLELNKVEQKKSLLAISVGIKQKTMVDKIVKKFIDENFTVMLFHYDGLLDGWQDLDWNDRAIHISAKKQTKWWFAKRFLHPDIVDEYDYIFLWDEDLGVENFNPAKYVSIIKEEGLEISQPALDPRKSKVHHQITVRNRKSRVHRRYYRSGRCEESSESLPCLGWVESMAPVFSRSAWRCTWYMIQNDLIHAWGLDMLLGYCAQGDRKQKVGIVDAEYVVHLGLPTLGSTADKNQESSSVQESSNHRTYIRSRSYSEMREFRRRWSKAAEDDKCWTDPYKETNPN